MRKWERSTAGKERGVPTTVCKKLKAGFCVFKYVAEACCSSNLCTKLTVYQLFNLINGLAFFKGTYMACCLVLDNLMRRNDRVVAVLIITYQQSNILMLTPTILLSAHPIKSIILCSGIDSLSMFLIMIFPEKLHILGIK